jgi:hypothetical protein
MSSIITALSDLVSSLIELVWSFFTTAFSLVESTAQFAARFASEILQLVINFFTGLVDLAGGIVNFFLGRPHAQPLDWRRLTTTGNLAMLAVLAAAFFGFLQYQRSQGRAVQVGNKKLN